MPIVDAWMIADNSSLPREIIAKGGLSQTTEIKNTKKFKIISPKNIK